MPDTRFTMTDILINCNSLEQPIIYHIVNLTLQRLVVQPGFLGLKFFFGFYVIRIGNTAIHRANCRTLGLFMKARTLRTLARNDIIKLRRNRFLIGFRIQF